MVLDLYANLSASSADVVEKKKATPKQLAALQKAREARQKKLKGVFTNPESSESVSSTTATTTTTTATTVPTIVDASASTEPVTTPEILVIAEKPIKDPKVEKIMVDIPSDEIPPKWFQKFIAQRIEEKMLQTTRKKRAPSIKKEKVVQPKPEVEHDLPIEPENVVVEDVTPQKPYPPQVIRGAPKPARVQPYQRPSAYGENSGFANPYNRGRSIFSAI